MLMGRGDLTPQSPLPGSENIWGAEPGELLLWGVFGILLQHPGWNLRAARCGVPMSSCPMSEFTGGLKQIPWAKNRGEF